MRILYIGMRDALSRHELGFMASLKSLGYVDLAIIGSGSKVSEGKLKIVSDKGLSEVAVLNLDASIVKHAYRFATVGKAEKLLKFFKKFFEYYDVIFTTPREPLALSIALRWGLDFQSPTILRLWSIRAAKFKDNLRFKAYGDIAIFLPSVIANYIYITLSNASITVDHATYTFARLAYPFYASKLYKIYPPYGYIHSTNSSKEYDDEVLNLVDSLDDYVLGFTTLSKHGSYLKFEARPHALMLYSLARKLRDVDVALAGSSYEDWIRVFPRITPPKNLHFIRRGFSDRVLKRLYGKARLVIVPITNRNISNRLLEALFFSKPVITSEVARLIHPELKHGEHAYISHWDSIIEDAIRVIRDDALLSKLENGAKEAYARHFSTNVNSLLVAKLIKALKA